MASRRSRRSTLSKGGTPALRGDGPARRPGAVRRDAERPEQALPAVGPFARLEAGAVAGQDGKTRAAVTNLFGSQAAFQAETMALALDSGDWIEGVEPPAPERSASPDEWLDTFMTESDGDRRARRPPRRPLRLDLSVWLSTVPYGLWNKRIAASSMDEYAHSLARLEAVFQRAPRPLRPDPPGRDHRRRPRLRVRVRGRGRVAQPVLDDAAPRRAIGADCHGPTSVGPAPVARSDRARHQLSLLRTRTRR